MSGGVRALALLELLMGVGALAWARSSGTELPWAFDARVLGHALWMTAVLVGVNFGVFFAGRRVAAARPLYDFFEQEVFPFLREASVIDLLVVAAIAGFAEELLFRGMLMPRMGLVASSVLFGFLHGPDYKLWIFALWAALVGAAFGVLYRETANLALPVLVHGLYDAVALMYIKWSPPSSGKAPNDWS